MMDFINIKNVMKQYKNGVTAVYDINLTINKGEFVFIMGASGSGKSTLIKLLYREEKPSKGEITLAGTNVAKLKNRKVFKLRRKLGIVFQDFRLLPKLTVYENVAFSLEILGLKKQEVREKTLKALDLVGLKSKVKDYPDQLSGGEQQRVVIARAIVNEPKLLICDEPTGNLDPKTSMGIMKVIEEINELGTTVIMATHNVDIVKKLNKRVILMENGKVIKDYKEGTYKHEMD
ncbi:MAG: cell division ATP-binding protein FtsE [Tenericutes bacterium]|nr:cell division ATP-binding protein FtsE [Bacilli bacterium]MDD4624527.1 cell division ATP-binding protein FtsE [Bacilli bacterium]NLV90603.1 cell division ATP-binding protein FtsE [Mycoplasmatota bacterium]